MRRKPIRTSVGDPCATSSFATLNCPVEHSDALDVRADAFDDADDPYDPSEFISEDDDEL